MKKKEIRKMRSKRRKKERKKKEKQSKTTFVKLESLSLFCLKFL